ncbi:MAG: hypothetical protein II361_02900 [Alistipes sp.]|nr:hypothetical protein [Alistipes sp.]
MARPKKQVEEVVKNEQVVEDTVVETKVETQTKAIEDDKAQKLEEELAKKEAENKLSRSDIVTLHTPLDRTTHHLINDRTMALMHNDAVLINASRGEVVSTQALLNAPQRLLIDVWEHEPEIDRDLLAKAIVTTPHIAGYSSQGKANATAMVVRAAAKRFSLPLTDWYPEQVRITERQDIDWQTMCLTIQSHCDLEAESQRLKAAPGSFESMRNGYRYREEYF